MELAVFQLGKTLLCGHVVFLQPHVSALLLCSSVHCQAGFPLRHRSGNGEESLFECVCFTGTPTCLC